MLERRVLGAMVAVVLVVLTGGCETKKGKPLTFSSSLLLNQQLPSGQPLQLGAYTFGVPLTVAAGDAFSKLKWKADQAQAMSGPRDGTWHLQQYSGSQLINSADLISPCKMHPAGRASYSLSCAISKFQVPQWQFGVGEELRWSVETDGVLDSGLCLSESYKYIPRF